MTKFIIDEDLPRSTSQILVKAGYEVFDVRDIGLRGASDNEIFAYAKAEKAILISADLGFANTLRFQINSSCSIMVLRFPNEMSNISINEQLLKAVTEFEGKEIYGKLIVVEPGRMRIHNCLKKMD